MRVINCGLIIFIGLFLSNCTIQKRSYNKGYFVQWNWKKNRSNNEFAKSLTNLEKDEILLDENLNESAIKLVEFDEITELETNSSEEQNKLILPNEERNNLRFKSEIAFPRNDLQHKVIESINRPKFFSFSPRKEKEKKKDAGLVVHRLLTISLTSFLLGVILVIRGLSTNYINFAFLPGLLFSFGGALLLFVSLILALNWAVRKGKGEFKDMVLPRKRYGVFIAVEVLLALTSGLGLLLAFVLGNGL
jgi:hypothetical protein